MARKYDSRWQCPKCQSLAVHISLPAWFVETTSLDLDFQEADDSADILAWYCRDCGEGGAGRPDEVPS